MNKNAVAMAADSAVTLSGEKVFNTANKVFALSKYHPVGLMIYGNAELMGIPWETLVKVFRQRIGSKSSGKLEEYAAAFIEFLRSLIGEEGAIDASRQEEHFAQGVLSLFMYLRHEIETELEKLFPSEDGATVGDISRVVATIVRKHYQVYRNGEFISGLTIADHRATKRLYASQLREWRKSVFEQLPISPQVARQLGDLAVGIFTKAGALEDGLGILGHLSSGVVIAGYGDDQMFPSLREYELFGVVGGHLAYRPRRSTDIGKGHDSAIIPFAQSGNMANRFMEGVDPLYQRILETSLREVWEGSLGAVIDAIQELDEAQKECYTQEAKEAGAILLDNYIQNLKNFRAEKFWKPVMQVVSSLPKDELAEMAESLVNLTSLKMKVSGEQETVGGPIDVAVISKGDGLIWIKRKHYFKPELNQHFFKNYYRETDDDDGTEKPKED